MAVQSFVLCVFIVLVVTLMCPRFNGRFCFISRADFQRCFSLMLSSLNTDAVLFVASEWILGNGTL